MYCREADGGQLTGDSDREQHNCRIAVITPVSGSNIHSPGLLPLAGCPGRATAAVTGEREGAIDERLDGERVRPTASTGASSAAGRRGRRLRWQRKAESTGRCCRFLPDLAGSRWRRRRCPPRRSPQRAQARSPRKIAPSATLTSGLMKRSRGWPSSRRPGRRLAQMKTSQLLAEQRGEREQASMAGRQAAAAPTASGAAGEVRRGWHQTIGRADLGTRWATIRDMGTPPRAEVAPDPRSRWRGRRPCPGARRGCRLDCGSGARCAVGRTSRDPDGQVDRRKAGRWESAAGAGPWPRGRAVAGPGPAGASPPGSGPAPGAAAPSSQR